MSDSQSYIYVLLEGRFYVLKAAYDNINGLTVQNITAKQPNSLTKFPILAVVPNADLTSPMLYTATSSAVQAWSMFNDVLSTTGDSQSISMTPGLSIDSLPSIWAVSSSSGPTRFPINSKDGSLSASISTSSLIKGDSLWWSSNRGFTSSIQGNIGSLPYQPPNGTNVSGSPNLTLVEWPSPRTAVAHPNGMCVYVVNGAGPYLDVFQFVSGTLQLKQRGNLYKSTDNASGYTGGSAVLAQNLRLADNISPAYIYVTSVGTKPGYIWAFGLNGDGLLTGTISNGSVNGISDVSIVTSSFSYSLSTTTGGSGGSLAVTKLAVTGSDVMVFLDDDAWTILILQWNASSSAFEERYGPTSLVSILSDNSSSPSGEAMAPAMPACEGGDCGSIYCTIM